MAIISDELLIASLESVRYIPGDFAEVGVFRGDTFKRLAAIAGGHNKKAHAFDSFEGMAEPSMNDLGHYKKGVLSVGGIDNFIDILNKAGINPKDYALHKGFIPHCFEGIDQKFSFILLDVDQYNPTKEALPWCWEHLETGGLLLLDDYFREKQGLASLAINEWLKTIHPLDFRFIRLENTQLMIEKL